MEKSVKERTLEEKMAQLITDHEQIKLVFQHIQVDNLMSGPSYRTPDEHHRENHTTLEYFYFAYNTYITFHYVCK